MNRSLFLGAAAALLLSFPAAPDAGAQDPPVADAPPVHEIVIGDSEPPADLATQEEARSRLCVPALIRLGEVDRELEPLVQRIQRIGALHNAITVEDSLRVTPFDDADPLERAVREWFQADGELAVRIADTDDAALREERSRLRIEIQEGLEEAYVQANEEGQAVLGDAGGLNEAARICDGAILVRSAVLEACEVVSGDVCEAAREAEPVGPFRFVDDAVDLWDIEQIRPWSQPSALQPTPDGSLGGARTVALTRRGNVTLVVGVEPMIHSRAEVDETLAAEFDQNLEALGIPFEHPGFVMAPAVSLEFHLPGPLAGESHYLLHFGDLADPETDLLWASPIEDDGFFQAAFPATLGTLERLMDGEALFLTAVRPSADGGEEGEPVYTLDVPAVGQGQAVAALLAYMIQGGLSQDFLRFVPAPTEGGG